MLTEKDLSLCRKQVLQYREESRQLDECERLKDSRQLKQAWHRPDYQQQFIKNNTYTSNPVDKSGML